MPEMLNIVCNSFSRAAMESWRILNESAAYILFGLLIAGFLKAFMPENFVQRHLGKSDWISVFKAALLGIPLPLCSCGVVPAAMGLRKSGASRGATVSFLISTPETGVDSIAVTYALLDPVMTVIRPIAAFITSATAGIMVNFLPEEQTENTSEIHANPEGLPGNIKEPSFSGSVPGG